MPGLDVDLAARWTPSDSQDELASEHLRLTGQERCYTAHVLVDKEQGWWGPNVALVHVEAVFWNRDDASKAAVEATQEQHRITGKPCTGGYTVHRPISATHHDLPRTADGRVWQTSWAVFEDILASAPEPSWKKDR